MLVKLKGTKALVKIDTAKKMAICYVGSDFSGNIEFATMQDLRDKLKEWHKELVLSAFKTLKQISSILKDGFTIEKLGKQFKLFYKSDFIIWYPTLKEILESAVFSMNATTVLFKNE